jgi:hypothetical protein
VMVGFPNEETSPLPQRACLASKTSMESGNERPPAMGGGSVSSRSSTSRSAADDGRDAALVTTDAASKTPSGERALDLKVGGFSLRLCRPLVPHPNAGRVGAPGRSQATGTR